MEQSHHWKRKKDEASTEKMLIMLTKNKMSNVTMSW